MIVVIVVIVVIVAVIVVIVVVIVLIVGTLAIGATKLTAPKAAIMLQICRTIRHASFVFTTFRSKGLTEPLVPV